MTKQDMNGWIRLAIMAPGFGTAVWLNTEWPVFVAVGVMIFFQIANGEGFE